MLPLLERIAIALEAIVLELRMLRSELHNRRAS